MTFPNAPALNLLHPDDVLFFAEVTDVMRRVANHYDLPLTGVQPLPMPRAGMSDRWGDCNGSGLIRLVMRCTVDGHFCEEPCSPEEIWKTAAHELAHLRHLNHGAEFQAFRVEMEEAVSNFRVDHRQKVIDRLVKMQASRDSEAQLGNTAAAEAFAAAINRMLIEHELQPSDLDYARATDSDPVIEVEVNLSTYNIPLKKTRIAWQETLAGIVANAHLCKFLLLTGSNRIIFVGTKSHATVAEYAFGTLVHAAIHLSNEAYHQYGLESIPEFGKWKAKEPGFREAWLAAFCQRIRERMDEARKVAVAQAEADVPGGSSTALIRLNGALLKAKQYIDDKYSKGKASALSSFGGRNEAGRERGRAAADSMAIGRKALTKAAAAPKLLK